MSEGRRGAGEASPGKTGYYLGVDLGGTKILTGLADGTGRLVEKRLALTPSTRSWRPVARSMVEAIRTLLGDRKVPVPRLGGIGIAVPGTVNRSRTRILHAPNLAWNNVDIKEYFEHHLQVPVHIENDGNLGALGVKYFGEGQPAHSIVGVFVGTGIGGGIILNGRIHAGANGTAGEIGHLVIDPDGPVCGCGSRGCWETLVSRRSLYEQLLPADGIGGSAILRRSRNRARGLREACRRGEPATMAVVQEMSTMLGLGVGSLINVLGPDLVVLGGGVMDDIGRYLLPRAVRVARKHAMAGAATRVKILQTKLGADATLLGAIALAMMPAK